jgi:hypothetical protein
MNTRCLVAVFALFAFGGLARAETNSGECVEWMIADSDHVVVGKITNVEKSGEHEIVTVDVSRSIRGKHDKTIRFTVRAAGRPVAAEWEKAKVEMLFCLQRRDALKDKKDLPDNELVLRYSVSHHSALFLGKTDQRAADAFTRDFKELTEPGAILKYAEAYAKTIPPDWKKKHVVVDLPFRAPIHKKLYGGSAVYFTLPADPALEADARRWAKSENPDERSRGVRCLRAFPNEQNTAILKGLLADGAYSTGDGKKYYYIRRAAYEALHELGVKVDRPVLEAPEK